MNRIPELRSLSSDHQQGLVLAVEAKRIAAGKDSTPLTEAWREVERRFEIELEPHFRIEEEFLAEPLKAAGELELVKEFSLQHKTLRDCVNPASGRTAEDLARFGRLLDEHIRFEERVFFEAAQQRLTGEELKKVAEACLNRSSGLS